MDMEDRNVAENPTTDPMDSKTTQQTQPQPTGIQFTPQILPGMPPPFVLPPMMRPPPG